MAHKEEEWAWAESEEESVSECAAKGVVLEAAGNP